MILAVLQARFSSSRLPGKVLMPLVGRPMLEREIERVRRARRVDSVVVATSTDASDDKIAALCEEIGTECFRGSLNDVLDRFYQAARGHAPDAVVRITGDCPLIDPDVIDKAVGLFLTGATDYVSNALAPTYPDGLDVEVVRMAALEVAWREAKLPSEREHVTPFIWKQPDRFRAVSIQQDNDLSGLRWTVDTAADYEFVSRVYETLYPANPAFTTAEVLALLEREPELARINGQQSRNEGYAKSLAADAIAGKSHG